VRIAELAAMLERKTDSIRNSRRLWPAAEAAELVKIAAQEHILSKPRRPISTSDFSLGAWEARTTQQTWDD
jgi:hypothetical protein